MESFSIYSIVNIVISSASLNRSLFIMFMFTDGFLLNLVIKTCLLASHSLLHWMNICIYVSHFNENCSERQPWQSKVKFGAESFLPWVHDPKVLTSIKLFRLQRNYFEPLFIWGLYERSWNMTLLRHPPHILSYLKSWRNL